MRNSDSAVLRNTLAACVALAFGITCSGHAATLTVTDCSDGAGSGTLRHTIAAATTSGDIVNIPAALNCSTITLTQGQILAANRPKYHRPGRQCPYDPRWEHDRRGLCGSSVYQRLQHDGVRNDYFGLYGHRLRSDRWLSLFW